MKERINLKSLKKVLSRKEMKNVTGGSANCNAINSQTTCEGGYCAPGTGECGFAGPGRCGCS